MKTILISQSDDHSLQRFVGHFIYMQTRKLKKKSIQKEIRNLNESLDGHVNVFNFYVNPRWPPSQGVVLWQYDYK